MKNLIGVTLKLGKNGRAGKYVLVGSDGFSITKRGWATRKKALMEARKEIKRLISGKISRRLWIE